jgi:phosphopantothenoylcysteine decarboxylase/phosphopantothenate--cysteine ligase
LTASLRGARIVVSAGPTYEDIDTVRFIGNRSSGRMGFAIAAAAAQRGAQVVLVAGPVHLDTPAGVTRVDVRSAVQMQAAVLAALPADVYIGAAAVADFAPAEVAPRKLKKSDAGDGLVLALVRTPDILAGVATHALRPRLVVGFAAETHDVARYARDKLARKQLDLIAANLVGVAGSGFESESNTLTVYGAQFERALGPAPKTQLAGELLELIAARLPRTPAHGLPVDGMPSDRAP